MKLNKLIPGLLLAPLMALTTVSYAEPVRDCIMEGTLKKNPQDSDKVYVAFHSAKPAEDGANCRLRRREKLQFKAPADSGINSAPAGSQVEYRYTEDAEGSQSWKLRKVSS